MDWRQHSGVTKFVTFSGFENRGVTMQWRSSVQLNIYIYVYIIEYVLATNFLSMDGWLAGWMDGWMD